VGRRLPSLTSLRFAAALVVLLYHSSKTFLIGAPAAKLFAYGEIGVTFFFVLSGFVLTWSRKPDVTSARFIGNRLARIWPLHALTWLLVVVLLAVENVHRSGLHLIASLGLVQVWTPDSSYWLSVNGPSWTLSCELFFYLMFPLMIHFVAQWDRAALYRGAVSALMFVILGDIGLGGGGHTLGHPALAQYLLVRCPVFRFGEFALGVFIARLVSIGWRPPLSLPWIVGWTVAPWLATVALFGANGYYWALEAVTLPGITLLIATCAVRDVSGTRSWLTNRWAVRLGQWSFALYLIQRPILRWLSHYGVGGGNQPIQELLFIIGVVAASGFVYAAFERPAERYLRARLARRVALAPT
jgi:peptidoglycan/LPS O-acetylase OafA/YrhL